MHLKINISKFFSKNSKINFQKSGIRLVITRDAGITIPDSDLTGGNIYRFEVQVIEVTYQKG